MERKLAMKVRNYFVHSFNKYRLTRLSWRVVKKVDQRIQLFFESYHLPLFSHMPVPTIYRNARTNCCNVFLQERKTFSHEEKSNMKYHQTMRVKDKIIAFKARGDDYDLLTQAAEGKEISRSELLRQAMREKSQRILKELGRLADQTGHLSVEKKKEN